MNNIQKSRIWATIVYEESAKENWIQKLEENIIPAVISPPHDQDKKEDGTLKKKHYHVMWCYDGPATQTKANEVKELIGGVGLERVDSKKCYYDYLTHKNNPEKAQYKEEDIIKLNGFIITENEDTLSFKEVEEYKKMIIKIVRDLDMHEYATLIEYLLDNNQSELLQVASNKTMFFNGYISSRRYSIANKDIKSYNQNS